MRAKLQHFFITARAKRQKMQMMRMNREEQIAYDRYMMFLEEVENL